jgi:hypothetical protein
MKGAVVDGHVCSPNNLFINKVRWCHEGFIGCLLS